MTVSVLTGIGALTAATLWGQATGDISSALLTLDIAAGLASLALLPVLLRWPVPGALALAVLAALSPAATPASTYATLHVSLRRRFPVAAAVAGAGVAGLLIRGLWRPISSLPSVWWVVLVLVAEAALVGWGELSRPAALLSLRSRPAGPRPSRPAGSPRRARPSGRASPARCTTCSPTGCRCSPPTPGRSSTARTHRPSSSPAPPGWSARASTRRSTSCAR